MFTKEIKKLVDVLIEREISKSEEKDLVVYGLTIGIELCFNIGTTIVLGVLFGMIFESLVLLVSFSFIRTYSGGYHCRKAIDCYFMSNGIIVFVLAIVKFTPREYILAISGLLLLFSIPILLKFAPMETETKLLDEYEQKHYRKKMFIHLFIECTIIPVLFLTRLYTFAFVICLGIMVSATLIIMQKLFKRKWGDKYV